MNNRTLASSRAALGPRLHALALLSVAVGLLAFAVGLVTGLGGVVFATLAASWLFTAGVAAGALAVSAAVQVARGRWAGVAPPVADATVGFFPPALVLLAVVVAGARLWMPPAALPEPRSVLLLAARDLLATALLFGAGWRFARDRAGGRPSLGVTAVVYLLLYAGTLSIWAMDLVMALRRGAPSSMVPAYYFMGAFLCGIAWVALLGSLRREPVTATTRLDFSLLIFAFSTFWAYLLWSSYLPIWYANLPEERGALVLQWAGAWRFLSGWTLLGCFLLPFLFFFPEAGRRGRWPLAAGAGMVLAGFLGERFLLVYPALTPSGRPLGAVLGAGTAIGVLGTFLLGVGLRLGGEKQERGSAA